MSEIKTLKWSRQFPEGSVTEKLSKDHPVSIKWGIDPTTPHLHLGHFVALRQLKRFQDGGHVVDLVIGDFTAQIGDPSGRDSTRPILSKEAVADNALRLATQIRRFLNPDLTRFYSNSSWLDEVALSSLLRDVFSRVTLNQLLHKNNFHERFKDNSPITMAELTYPLMQAWDSVILKTDIELGGQDQMFNIAAGRDLQASHHQPQQAGFLLPILTGLDGKEKMSKSKNNTVNIDDTPQDMFGKIMSISDQMMSEWFPLLTDLSEEEIAVQLDVNKTHPRDAKAFLAWNVVSQIHSSTIASEAKAEFDRVFKKHEFQQPVGAIIIQKATKLANVIKDCQFAESVTKARKLIEQGAVRLDGIKVSDVNFEVVPSNDKSLLTVGKRHATTLVGFQPVAAVV